MGLIGCGCLVAKRSFRQHLPNFQVGHHARSERWHELRSSVRIPLTVAAYPVFIWIDVSMVGPSQSPNEHRCQGGLIETCTAKTTYQRQDSKQLLRGSLQVPFATSQLASGRGGKVRPPMRLAHTRCKPCRTCSQPCWFCQVPRHAID